MLALSPSTRKPADDLEELFGKGSLQFKELPTAGLRPTIHYRPHTTTSTTIC